MGPLFLVVVIVRVVVGAESLDPSRRCRHKSSSPAENCITSGDDDTKENGDNDLNVLNSRQIFARLCKASVSSTMSKTLLRQASGNVMENVYFLIKSKLGLQKVSFVGDSWCSTQDDVESFSP